MSDKKFKLTAETKVNIFGITLFRMQATVSFRDVTKGDLGGWLESDDVYGDARVYGDAWVYGNAQVYGNARVYGNAQVYGDAWVYGNAQVYGNARVSESMRIVTGFLSFKISSLRKSIAAQLGVYIEKEAVLYKRVNKISAGKYKSCYDPMFIYEDGQVAEVKNYDKSKQSCAAGLHVSTPLYWNEGNTLIAVKVKYSDMITCQEGKIRCKKLTVIGEVKL